MNKNVKTYERMLKQKIEVGKSYANVFIDQNSGLTVTYQEVT